MESNTDHLDAMLAATALVEAYIRGDIEGVDAVLSDQDDQDAIMSSLLFMLKDILTKVSGGHPEKVLDGLRSRLLARISEGGGEQ
ncbi:hypothetical protein [Mycobacterium sp. 236(2023)]|uniref:hypothetical protein n=1 Tax=Mycobacterium sp. 236(2023) TaxID=3038163 RepID=UPI002414F201|nr:hypothetical protein [Mycobacterium sp. 236(2023)]MDG4667817.1 hypothetical protein [Mycobacterium sp. 236(2023)]